MPPTQVSVDTKTIKSTQDLLGKVIKKPQLTEKLLKRPPFKFLHDIVTNVIKSNPVAFSKLYSEDQLVADNITDKDAKIEFLQRIIDVLGFIQGKTLTIKAGKVVAGLEPEKTNEFLQILAKSVITKKDFPAAIEKVLAGEKLSTKSLSQPDLSETSAKKTVKNLSSNATATKSRSSSSDRTNKQNKTATKSSSPRANALTTQHKSSTENGKNLTQASSPAIKKSTIPLSKQIEPEESNETILADIASSIDQPKESQSPILPHLTVRPPTSVQRDQSSPNRSRAPPTARPTTARAAPPKVLSKRDIEDLNERVEVEQRVLEMRPVENLISERDLTDKDEDFLVDETKAETEPDEIFMSKNLANIANGGDDKKGSLVKQLVESKLELDGDAVNESQAEQDNMNRLVIRDISRIRESIQNLTRLAVPLGRVLDYLQEDISSMVAEYRQWEDEHRQNLSQFEQHKSAISKDLDPIRYELDKLDRQIDETYNKINARKAAIIKNEQTIRKMINIAVERTDI